MIGDELARQTSQHIFYSEGDIDNNEPDRIYRKRKESREYHYGDLINDLLPELLISSIITVLSCEDRQRRHDRF